MSWPSPQPDDEDLAEASTGADEAGPYRYVTGLEGKTFAEVGPPEEGDALSPLTRFAETVRNPSASQEEKALASRFIIHIVGDLHQPLHTGNCTDQSGNDQLVRRYGQVKIFHSVWHTQMLARQNLSYNRIHRVAGAQAR